MSELWEALDRAPTLGVTSRQQRKTAVTYSECDECDSQIMVQDGVWVDQAYDAEHADGTAHRPITSRKQRTAATWGSVQITVVDSLPYPPSGESFKTPCVVMGHRGRIQLIANPGYVEDLPVDTLDEAVGHVSMRVQENADRLGTTDYTLYVYRDARTGSRRTAATPGWLSERNNDPYGTPGNHEFWTTVDFTDIGKVRVFERDGKGYLHHRMQNYWMNFPSLDAATEHANSADQNLDMWASKTAGWDDGAYYNDADIEQMQLDSGFYDDEPPCPGCGAYDSVVAGDTFIKNGYGNLLQQQMVQRRISGSGIDPRNTVVCLRCYAVADNRGGSGMRLLSSRKTAWTADGSDISPMAQTLMDLTDEVSEEFGGDAAWNAGTSREAVEAALSERIKPLLNQISTEDEDTLTDYNYHVTNRAILRAHISQGTRSSKTASDMENSWQTDFDANRAYWSGAADAARQQEEARKRLYAWKGQEVTVVKGRKIPKGTTGTVFYSGEGQWGWRIGFKTADGQELWTSLQNVELTSEMSTTSSKTASRDLESVARAFSRYWGGEFAGIQNSPVSLVDGLWDGPWAVVRNEYGEWAKIKDISGEDSGQIENHRPNPNHVPDPDNPWRFNGEPPYLYDKVMRPAGTYAVFFYDHGVQHITTENGRLVLEGYNGNVALGSKTATSARTAVWSEWQTDELARQTDRRNPLRGDGASGPGVRFDDRLQRWVWSTGSPGEDGHQSGSASSEQEANDRLRDATSNLRTAMPSPADMGYWTQEAKGLWMCNGTDGDYAWARDNGSWEVHNSAGSKVADGQRDTLVDAKAWCEYVMARRADGDVRWASQRI